MPAPNVVSTNPPSGATNVSRYGDVVATFDVPLHYLRHNLAAEPLVMTLEQPAGTVILQNSAQHVVPITFNYNDVRRTAKLRIRVCLKALQPSTTYTAKILGAKSYDGTPMAAPYSWTFTTESAAGGGPVSTNITPTMTSMTTPAPYVVTMSDAYGGAGGGFDGSKVFDQILGTFWNSAGTIPTGWIALDMGRLVVMTQYAITATPRSQYIPIRCPKIWTFEGSLDGTTWNVLDTQTNVTSWSTVNEVRTYSFSNSTQYRYFRLNISSANDGGNYLEFAELTIYGY